MIFSTTYCTLSKGVLFFLMKGSPFSNMQTCHGLYWRKLSTCVLKVFVIKSNVEPFLQSAVFQDVTCVSLFWICSGFPHLSPAAFHLSALPYSLSSFANKTSCNSYLASQFSSWWQLPPSPSVLRKSWMAECINQGSKICIAWESVLQGDGRGEDTNVALTVGWHTPPAENWIMRQKEEVHRLERPPPPLFNKLRVMWGLPWLHLPLALACLENPQVLLLWFLSSYYDTVTGRALIQNFIYEEISSLATIVF